MGRCLALSATDFQGRGSPFIFITAPSCSVWWQWAARVPPTRGPPRSSVFSCLQGHSHASGELRLLTACHRPRLHSPLLRAACATPEPLGRQPPTLPSGTPAALGWSLRLLHVPGLSSSSGQALPAPPSRMCFALGQPSGSMYVGVMKVLFSECLKSPPGVSEEGAELSLHEL